MLHAGLSPPFPCQSVIYGGDTEGGRGYYMTYPPMPLSTGGGEMLITFFDPFSESLSRLSQLLFVSLYCTFQKRGGPSRLHPALYFGMTKHKKIPHSTMACRLEHSTKGDHRNDMLIKFILNFTDRLGS